MIEANEKEDGRIKRKRISEFLLIVTTILWGTTFIITKNTTQVIPPLFYIGVRFIIGFLVFIPFFKHFKSFSKDKNQIKISIIAGFFYFVSIVAQTFGLRFTTASKGAFITAISVIMVPVFLAIFFKEKSSTSLWIGVMLALIGTGILSFEGIEKFEIEQIIGDVLIFICAVFYAIYIIYIGKKANKVDMLPFTALQLFLISILSFILSFFTGELIQVSENTDIIFSTSNILILIYMGAIATSLPFLFQGFGQKNVSSTRAAIIFALEPVFATIFAILLPLLLPFLLEGESLNLQTILGSIFIFIGIIISIERKSKKKE